MTFESLMTIFAGGLFLIACGLVVFIFMSLKSDVINFKSSFDEFREMLDLKLTNLGHALSNIDKDLRGEIHVHDRRITVLETVKDGTRKQRSDKIGGE